MALPPIDTTSTASKMYLPPGWDIGPDGSLINYNSATPDPTRGGALGATETYAPYDVFQMGGNWVTFDPVAGIRRATAAEIKTASSGGGGTGTDPAQIAYEYASLSQKEQQDLRALQAQYTNMGLDAESARRQALTTLITNRNNTAVSTAQTSADIAKTAATFAANPRDTYAEALYRGQVGGSTPFGDTNNAAFGTYGKALADKVASIFQPVAADMNQLRQYRDSIPPVDFFGAETRNQLGLPPTSAQAISGAGVVAPATAPAAAPAAGNDNAGALQFLQAMQNPQTANDFQRWVTTASGNPQDAPKPYGVGGKVKILPRIAGGNVTGSGGFGSVGGFAMGTTGAGMKIGPDGAGSMGPPPLDMGNPTRFGSAQPSSSEGGTNMNIHEQAFIVGKSGHVYATIAENGYPEQVKISPTPSGKKAAMAAEKGQQASQDMMSGGGMKKMGTGGTATASPSLDEMNNQYSQLLQRLGGSGGGSSTPFAGARFLAGAPWAGIQADPFLQGITDASYSMRGIDPAELAAQVKQFTPNTSQNNFPRVNFG